MMIQLVFCPYANNITNSIFGVVDWHCLILFLFIKWQKLGIYDKMLLACKGIFVIAIYLNFTALIIALS